MGLKQEQKKLEQNYEQEVTEILVLLGDKCGGAGMIKNGIWEATADMLAYIDLTTQELIKTREWIAWLAEDKDRKDWIHNLKNKTIYRLKVHKKKQGNKNAGDRAFLLVEVVERDVEHPGLHKILEEYDKPLIIEDKICGTFSLERQFGWFSGTIDWLGEECLAALECDSEDVIVGEETAKGALHTLHIIYKDLKEWDEKFRRFAAEKLTENANDWLIDNEELDEADELDNEEPDEELNEDEEEDEEDLITKEDFAERICISEITISPEGDYEVYYDDDDMFWGHVIIVSGNVETEIEEAYIAG